MKTILTLIFVSTFLSASICNKDNKYLSNQDIYFCLDKQVKYKELILRKTLNNDNIFKKKIRYIEAKAKYKSDKYKGGTYQPINYLEIKNEELEKGIKIEKKN